MFRRCFFEPEEARRVPLFLDRYGAEPWHRERAPNFVRCWLALSTRRSSRSPRDKVTAVPYGSATVGNTRRGCTPTEPVSLAAAAVQTDVTDSNTPAASRRTAAVDRGGR
jgi:hypothetical protein